MDEMRVREAVRRPGPLAVPPCESRDFLVRWWYERRRGRYVASRLGPRTPSSAAHHRQTAGPTHGVGRVEGDHHAPS